MGKRRSGRVWEIETLYGTEDIRVYLGTFVFVMAVGIFMVVGSLLLMDVNATNSVGLLIALGAFFVFVGVVTVHEVYLRYRELNPGKEAQEESGKIENETKAVVEENGEPL